MRKPTWADILTRKCNCFSSELEEVDGLPNCTRCLKCGGWFALRVSNDNTIAKLLAAFPPKPNE